MAEQLPERARWRAADAEREAVIEALHRHGAAGRLDLEELTERVGVALSAKTLGELDLLLADLPVEAARPRGRPWWRRRLALRAGELAVVDGFFVTIWGVTGHGSFWPAWLILLSAFVYLRGVLRELQRRERRREREERRSA
jgi:hypothetical protein